MVEIIKPVDDKDDDDEQRIQYQQQQRRLQIELIHDMKRKLMENGDYEKLRQRFLAELLLVDGTEMITMEQSSPTGGGSTNNSDNHNNIPNRSDNTASKVAWLHTILDGLRRQQSHPDNKNPPTFDEVATAVAWFGKQSVPSSVEAKMKALIQSAIKEQFQ